MEMVGIVGGTGLGSLIEGEEREHATPYGPVRVTLGRFGGRPVAFLARHGAAHTVTPHRIPARANLWAFADLGVRAIVSTAAVGSLRAEHAPESWAIPDQLLDRTYGRADTFYDGDLVRHLPFADPFCPVLRRTAISAVPDAAARACVAVIQGPRFSTRAEADVLRGAGADLVNMTLCPEVALAAELGMGTVTLCLVTDTDTGRDEGDPDAVTADLVFRRLADARPRMAAALERIVSAVPAGYAPRPLIDDEAIAHVLARPVMR
ncbi:MTAP family purine nucleoside phosphorylase [Agromyces marinus]|uniref:S-methyl-5'-thioadenosine phosphorylase n=1 Tax=Agromyces marinus TaxID=1389020 RepID=A0ABN6YB07_9MICO|nr:MTAP family purine nucleoside phosphorylase [Agromyces marinus]UIP57356.1 S-methyl-5'-thioadenosine phosphorylase [Agromyces marinus]BDZ54537.1 S-methyl-5'-thioadenosine phosphorylase [Agromyces marinus]